ncbi:MAG: hypothetical protein ACK5VE_03755 [Alphaproteobacteria bacterium]
MKSKLADADRIMAVPPRSWVMAMEPVDVTLMTGGRIALPMGARVRISCTTGTTGTTAFGVTEQAQPVMFGLEEAASFEPAHA